MRWQGTTTKTVFSFQSRLLIEVPLYENEFDAVKGLLLRWQPARDVLTRYFDQAE